MVDRSVLARLPKVDAVLDAEPLCGASWRRTLARRAIQAALADLRRSVLSGEAVDIPDASALAASVGQTLEQWARPRPMRVINATGVILHTNLGRAPLCVGAIEAMADAAGYCDLEVGLADGKRGSRFAWLRPFMCAVIGAQDVQVVNNNAAALLLACTVLGAPGGVVLSRGQMVEIGDSFRVATMAGAGGVRVVAVGSTNRTHLRDYEQALDGEGPDAQGQPASALLWCHQSNFKQSGYVKEVGLAELAKLAKARDVPLIADLGSGSLGEGLPAVEPTIGEYLDQGVDLVLASGDKLLGGPQAGIIAGTAKYVERCRRFPMSRALRPDKTALAALHATFAAHAREGSPAIPLHQMIALDEAGLRARADALRLALGWDKNRVVTLQAAIGGGSLPGDTMPSAGLWVPCAKPSATARALRLGSVPVIGRIEDERLLLDLRTVDPKDDAVLQGALTSLADHA
ncbi:MAG: L-seryl-tRNA(Sec) selenium transferase [Nannocystaceae bacterium]|nr:L-seryl-tRNA(Sec) selenium transferase [Nannocystaceae bacterium]